MLAIQNKIERFFFAKYFVSSLKKIYNLKAKISKII